MASKETKFKQPIPTKLSARIGYNVQRYRTESGISQQAFAKKLGLSPSMVAKLEAHKRSARRDPSLRTIEKVARVLGVDAAKLLQPTPEEKMKQFEARKALEEKERAAIVTADAAVV